MTEMLKKQYALCNAHSLRFLSRETIHLGCGRESRHWLAKEPQRNSRQSLKRHWKFTGLLLFIVEGGGGGGGVFGETGCWQIGYIFTQGRRRCLHFT